MAKRKKADPLGLAESDALYAELCRLAPLVCFTVAREEDPYFVWDGEGRDPQRYGYLPYDVDVAATVVAGGQWQSATASLGGSYYRPDEPPGMVSGYLPQMLLEAAEELLKSLQKDQPPGGETVCPQLEAACVFLRDYLRRRYDQQRRQIAQGVAPCPS